MNDGMINEQSFMPMPTLLVILYRYFCVFVFSFEQFSSGGNWMGLM